MIDREQFASLLDRIIAAELPAQLPTYQAFKSDLIEAVYSGQDPRENSDKAGQFEFGDSIKEALEILVLVWGTYKALKGMYLETRPAGNTMQAGSVADRWRAKLVQAGMDEKLADKIAKDF